MSSRVSRVWPSWLRMRRLRASWSNFEDMAKLAAYTQTARKLSRISRDSQVGCACIGYVYVGCVCVGCAQVESNFEGMAKLAAYT
jgi:hypothetical protein